MAITFRRSLAVAAAFLLLAYWSLIFLGTHLPMPPKGHVNVSDKFQHSGAYAGLAVLGLLAARAFRPRTLLLYLAVIAVGTAYGALDELTQLAVPNRSADWLDWLADIVGLVLGSTCFLVFDLLLLPAGAWARARGRKADTPS
jgi:VanZ family protein